MQTNRRTKAMAESTTGPTASALDEECLVEAWPPYCEENDPDTHTSEAPTALDAYLDVIIATEDKR